LATMIMVPLLSYGQEIDYDSLLQRIDTVENPVYKPVVSFSYGVLNFRGDVKNSLITPVIGNQAGMLNVSTFIDKKNNYFVANFNFLLGKLTANEYSYTDLTRNLNFETWLYSIGLNVEYRFGHLITQTAFIRPYVSLGIESINFSSKGDLQDADGMPYYYWSDGTIQNTPESAPGAAVPLYRDYDFETDLRLRENNEFGLGTYSQRSLAIPAGAGLHFLISRRMFFSLGISYHYTLTDYLDNVAREGTRLQGSKGNDSYVFSHLTLHFDLFSDPATRMVDLMFADAEFDPLFFDDEDGDFVLDVTDHCPGTPYGVEVDTLGCPLDGDMDGIPDYLDQELETSRGAWVDDQGVTVSEEAFYASIENRNEAMPREDVEVYLAMIRSEYRLSSSQVIPEKFKSLDEDNDGYLSFEELLKTVDLYFDFQLELDIDELRELNGFFFSQ
jgi:Ca2+-binding EF-hand superfamily protein